MCVRWRSCDPNQRRIRSAMREETEPLRSLGDPCNRRRSTRSDATTVAGSPARAGRYRSVRVLRLHSETCTRLADRERGGAAGLGDPVVLPTRIALDLELDPGVGADLEALLRGNLI